MDDAEPRTIAAFSADADTDELGAALAGALIARGMTITAPVTIEQATELNVELGGRLVSILVGAPGSDPTKRFLSIGQVAFASGRLIGQRDQAERRRLAELLDDVLRHDLRIADAEWMTPTSWKQRGAG